MSALELKNVRPLQQKRPPSMQEDLEGSANRRTASVVDYIVGFRQPTLGVGGGTRHVRWAYKIVLISAIENCTRGGCKFVRGPTLGVRGPTLCVGDSTNFFVG